MTGWSFHPAFPTLLSAATRPELPITPSTTSDPALRDTAPKWSPAEPSRQPDECVSCGAAVFTPYCAVCGERRASDRRHSLLEFIREHVVEAVINVDGRVIRSLKALIIQPGKATVEFMRGARMPYLAPIQFFLIMNLGFFVWATAVGNRFFDTQLVVHVRGMPYSATALRMVRERIARDSEPEAAYARRFNTMGTAQAKSLVITMVPAFALLVGVVTFRRKNRAPIVQHLVFSLHTFCFLLFLIVVSSYVIDPPIAYVLDKVGWPKGLYDYDVEQSLVTLAIFGAYIALALRRAYSVGRVRSILGAVALGLGFFVILTLYRGLLFWVTFHSV